MVRHETAFALSFVAVVLLKVPLICARTLDSYELAVGDWNMTMRCRKSSFTSEVFPPQFAVEQQGQRKRQGWQLWKDAPQSYDCRLSLFPNGTFALQPKNDDWNRVSGYHQQPASRDDEDNGPRDDSSPLYVPIHGRWKLDANPYCVTDRAFDSVTLTSRSRVQTRMTPTTLLPETQQRLQLLLQCRLSGRFTEGGLARRLKGAENYTRGRCSRGVILAQPQLQKLDITSRRRQRDKVVASFSARRYIPSSLNSFEEDNLIEDE